MPRQSIEIPDAVFEIELETDYGDRDNWVCDYTFSIVVGDVTVFTRAYHDSDERDDGKDVYDRDDAKERGLREFGERLRDLLGSDL